jgi:uncharacterized protein (DUF2141 family)
VIQLEGIRNAKGSIVLCVWNSAGAFPNCEKGKPVARQSVAAATAGSVPVVFRNIAPGTIAVSAFHDENDNGRFDTNFVGMPLEGVGLSNNPKMGFGPPKYRSATFTPRAGTVVRIKMGYL